MTENVPGRGTYMDEQTVKHLAAMLTERRGEILGRWVDLARTSLRGRQTMAELERQTSDLYSAIQSMLDGGTSSVEAPSAAELRSLLTDLSKSRARQGFSATE